MRKLIQLICMIFLLSGAAVALAGTVPEYSADMVDVKSKRVMQKVFVTPQMIRSESFDSGKLEALAIVRLDQHKMYLVMEESKTYAEIPFNKDSFSAKDLQMGMVESKREQVGKETVNGYSATKYKTTIKTMGMTVTSYEWQAPEFDLPIRTESNGEIQEMRNIQKGAPAAALFELPKGYARDANMENMMKGMMGKK